MLSPMTSIPSMRVLSFLDNGNNMEPEWEKNECTEITKKLKVFLTLLPIVHTVVNFLSGFFFGGWVVGVVVLVFA
jgi:hypothetical protein